jgi:hypothetical protein
MTQLWFDQPSILMKKSDISELFPTDTMSSNQKLNAIVRVVILLSIIGYVITKSPYIPIIALVSMFATVVYGKSVKKEGMTNPSKVGLDLQGNLQNEMRIRLSKNPTMSKDVDEHTMPSKSNPLMNVQLTEINDNPTRKAAAPSYNPAIQDKINHSTKDSLDPRLFKNVGDEIQFEHSMQRFHTTANTEIPNDQEGFAKFCYGMMPSCRGGDDKACVKNNYRHILR